MRFEFEIKEYFDRVEAVCKDAPNLTTIAYINESIRDEIVKSIFNFFEIPETEALDLDMSDLELEDGDCISIDCGQLIEEKELH